MSESEEDRDLPYSPVDGWPQQSVLPVTGARILLHQQIKRTQEVRKKKIDDNSNDREEEQPEDLVNDEEMEEGDAPALRMDVLSSSAL